MFAQSLLPACDACSAPSFRFLCSICELRSRFPESLCVWCLKRAIGESRFCPDCRRRSPWVSYWYEKAMQAWIRRIKEESQICAWKELRRRHLPQALFRADRKFEALVYVPSDPRLTKRRLFDSSRSLSLCLGKLLRLPVRRAFERYEFLSPQKQLSKKIRDSAARSCIELRSLPGTQLLLVDDVMTSGASLAHCTRLLEQAGASVEAYCIARKPLD